MFHSLTPMGARPNCPVSTTSGSRCTLVKSASNSPTWVVNMMASEAAVACR
jgi:hypothetical protein